MVKILSRPTGVLMSPEDTLQSLFFFVAFVYLCVRGCERVCPFSTIGDLVCLIFTLDSNEKLRRW